MKKGWKIFLIVCGSIACLGLALCIAGTAMGATLYTVREAYGSNRYFWHDDDYDDYDNDHDDWDESVSRSTGERTTSSGTEQSLHKGIRGIDMEVSYLGVTVQEYDGSDISVDMSELDSKLKNNLSVYEEEGELKIKTINDHVWKQIGSNESNYIVIQIPTGYALTEASFEMGAGDLEITGIECSSLDIHVGAGRAVVEEFKVNELDVECGAGQVDIQGTVLQDVSMECGVGELTAELSGKQTDYNYELKCDIGELVVGADKYTGLGRERNINNGAGRQMEISCGMGRVEVVFNEDL